MPACFDAITHERIAGRHDGGTRVGTHVKPLDSFVSASTSCLQLSQKGSAALLGMVATPAMVTASRTQSARESEDPFFAVWRKERVEIGESRRFQVSAPRISLTLVDRSRVLTRPQKNDG